MTAPVTQWRRDLAARLATATGWAAFDHPPPSLVPPCVVLLIGADYIGGPRRTGCLVDVAVTVRLVSDITEAAGLYDALDDAITAALDVIAAFDTVGVSARTYGDNRYLCADITVTDTAPLPLPAPRNRRQPLEV